MICSMFCHAFQPDGLYNELGLLKVTEIYYFGWDNSCSDIIIKCYPNSLTSISQNIVKFTATARGSQNYFDYLIIEKDIWEDV